MVCPQFACSRVFGCVALPDPLEGHQAYVCHAIACLCKYGQCAQAGGSLCHSSRVVAASAHAGPQEAESQARHALGGCIQWVYLPMTAHTWPHTASRACRNEFFSCPWRLEEAGRPDDGWPVFNLWDPSYINTYERCQWR